MTQTDGPSAEDLGRQIKICEALVAATEQRQEVFDVVCASPDPWAAQQALRDLLGIEEEPASAVVNLQVRNFTVEFRGRIADRLAELRTQAGN